MIISASRRTDIPAFFSDWFMHQIEAGDCWVRNPFNPKQSLQVSLEPDRVEAIVFWSKNPAPLMKHLGDLDKRGYGYYFQYTLNAYGPELEPHVPAVEERVETFIALAKRVGPRRVIWRYDPIVISTATPFDFHIEAFGRLASLLEGHTKRVIVSILDYYRKIERRLAELERLGNLFDRDAARRPTMGELLLKLRNRAVSSGMEIFACAEELDLSSLGILPARCIDGDLIHDLFGSAASTKKDRGQRPACGCAESRDVGTSNTCRHGCRYCYATGPRSIVGLQKI